MLHLANDTLRLDILDPTTEADRLGPRFTGGGFIWQIHDAQAGPLLSGPEGPEPHPEPFNGHGLPESFRDRTRAGVKLLWSDDEGLAPGVGLLRRSGGQVTLAQPCVWHILSEMGGLEFRTAHAAAGYACAVTRRIELAGRTVRSVSRITNTGNQPMNFQWFAHPFFALDSNSHLQLTVPSAAKLPADSGFTRRGNIIEPARRYLGKDDGAFTLLELPPAQPLDVQLTHPHLPRGIRVSTTFVPSECPIWINGFTFSIEPYQTLKLAPGTTQAWTLTYEFGADRSDGSPIA